MINTDILSHTVDITELQTRLPDIMVIGLALSTVSHIDPFIQALSLAF